MTQAARHGRDKCRTPTQWTSAPQAGFCPPDARPWLPVNPNAAQGVNVADQPQNLSFDLATGPAPCLFSSHQRPAGPQPLRHLTLAPFEVFIAALQ